MIFHLSIFGGLFADIGPVHGIVLLHLHGLHLLLDGVHRNWSSGEERCDIVGERDYEG